MSSSSSLLTPGSRLWLRLVWLPSSRPSGTESRFFLSLFSFKLLRDFFAFPPTLSSLWPTENIRTHQSFIKLQWIHTWVCKLLDPGLFGSNVHQRSSDIALQLAQGTLGSFLLTAEVCHGAANVVTIKTDDDRDRDGMNTLIWYSRGIHFELDPDLQLSSVVCLALARFALQWIPPGDIDVVNKERSDKYIILACSYLDLGLSWWSKLLSGSGTRPRNSSTPRKFLWRTVRTISAVLPLAGIPLNINFKTS